MANFIPLFSNVAFLKRYGNLGDKIALYWQSTPSDLVDILAQLRSKTGLKLQFHPHLSLPTFMLQKEKS
jgi:hypothetical protein